MHIQKIYPGVPVRHFNRPEYLNRFEIYPDGYRPVLCVDEGLVEQNRSPGPEAGESVYISVSFAPPSPLTSRFHIENRLTDAEKCVRHLIKP